MIKKIIRPRSNNNSTPLLVHDPRVLELSQQYGISTKAIAYIRSALKSRYTPRTLIQHIEEENDGRWKAIEEYKASETLSEGERKRFISETKANIEFREGVVDVLNRLGEIQLHDLLA